MRPARHKNKLSKKLTRTELIKRIYFIRKDLAMQLIGKPGVQTTTPLEFELEPGEIYCLIKMNSLFNAGLPHQLISNGIYVKKENIADVKEAIIDRTIDSIEKLIDHEKTIKDKKEEKSFMKFEALNRV